nr:protein FAM177A1-like [Ciona intestinalis]|eukprot:XP_002129010.1 protein FAM177A1-like [Ciona intestinalis]
METKANTEIMQDTTVLCGDNMERFKLDKNGKIKLPRRLIHCSDGILEEYSTDEEEEEEEADLPVVDPSTLRWGPYIWYMTVKSAFTGLAACDYLGEKLAYFFGITTPKYQYELNQLKEMEAEADEEEIIAKEEREAEEKAIEQAMRILETPALNVPDVTLVVDQNS